MITAVDTNVLLDVLTPGAPHGDSSEKALAAALTDGPVIVSEAVFAEIAGHFRTREQLDQFLEENGIHLQPSDTEVLYLAGRAWRDYVRRRPDILVCPSCGAPQAVQCPSCGARLLPRQHVLADCLIGAHASVHANRLLTRDRGYYRTYFPALRLA